MNNNNNKTGAILTVDAELQRLSTLVDRWNHGSLSNVDLANLVNRVEKHLQKACYCDEGVCCSVHSKHVSPHTNCVLR